MSLAILTASLLVVGRDDAEHRSEDLLLGDGRRVVDVAEHGRLDEPPALEVLRTSATRGERRAFVDPLGDVALHAVPLPAHGERPHLGLLVERVADAHLGEVLGQRLDHLVVPLTGDDDPRERRAHLPGHDALGPRDGSGHRRDVGVVEDDRRRLPAELEGAAGDAFAAQRRDLAARNRRAGEGDLVDPGIADEELRHLAVGGHDVEHPGREPDLLRRLGDQIALAGRLGRELQHHRAAGQQRRSDLVRDELERCVPGDDGAHHADGLADQQPEPAAHRRLRELLEREGVGERRVRLHGAGAHHRRVLRHQVRGARLPRPQLGHPVTPLLDRGTEGTEVSRPLGVRHARARAPRRTRHGPPRRLGTCPRPEPRPR